MSVNLYKKLFSYICGKPVVFVCIGSDLVSGDCLGPIVGQMLREANAPAFVYGTLESPVNALNVDEVGEFVRKTHPNHLIVAIDSAVGAKNFEGQICINKGALLPGAADGKRLNAIGDVAITAVTSSFSPKESEFGLVRLGFVYALAKRLCCLLCDCLRHSLYFAPLNNFATLDNTLTLGNILEPVQKMA